MRILTPFDPWQSKLCTCPPKLTLNPYTGCSHRCVYCYVDYVKDFFNCRPKVGLVSKLAVEAKNLKGELISISNSSDPYPPIEKKLKLTRKCLKILSAANCRVQIITKSTLVVRDVDILKRMKSMVALTITTLDDNLSKRLEPGAPLSSARIETAKILIKKGIPVVVRIDPIIPFLNDSAEELVKILAKIGVKHVVSSTYKVRAQNWQRFSLAFPSIARKLRPLYFEYGERRGRTYFLPRKIREELMKNVKEIVEKNGLTFGCCREGFPQLNSGVCDGSWVLS